MFLIVVVHMKLRRVPTTTAPTKAINIKDHYFTMAIKASAVTTQRVKSTLSPPTATAPASRRRRARRLRTTVAVSVAIATPCPRSRASRQRGVASDRSYRREDTAPFCPIAAAVIK